MRVLAVDPGLTRCGVAVVEHAFGGKLRMVHVEVVRTDSDTALEKRLLALHEELQKLFDVHAVDVLAIERVFSQHNVKSAIGTGQAAGVAMLVAAQHGIPVHHHTPTEVKASVTGSGSADKNQVAFMVTRILGLTTTPKPADASDALALGICHLWRTRVPAEVGR